MKLNHIGSVVFGVGLAALITILIFRHHIDYEKHKKVENNLHHFSSLNAVINQDLVLVFHGLLENYDSIWKNINTLQEILTNLRDEEKAYRDKHAQNDIKQAIETLNTTLASKEATIELFKANNAILKNSVTYCPSAMMQLNKILEKEQFPLLLKTMQQLLQNILIFSRPGQHYFIASEINILTKRLQQLNRDIPKSHQNQITNILQHIRVIVEHKKEVEQLLITAVDSPIEHNTRELSSTFNTYIEQQIYQIEKLRLFLYFCIMGLISLYNCYSY